MNRMITKITAGALAAAFAVAPVAAQNVPPPGNVNPGSMRSGAEQTGAPNQPRSWGYGTYGSYGYAPGAYYGEGYSAYGAESGRAYGPFGYQPGYGPYGLGTGGAGAIGSSY